MRVTGDQLAQLMFPHFDPEGARSLIATGMSASPGAAVGVAVFDSDAAVRIAAEGTPVILVRRETNPDDLHGMVAAAGILTSRGGKTSHAAVVARGMGAPASAAPRPSRSTRRAGSSAPLTAAWCARATPCRSTARPARSSSARSPCGPRPWCATSRAPCRSDEGGPVVAAVDRLMAVADKHRRMQVRANADNAPDAARARRFGAEGIGLCRTEHMFLGDAPRARRAADPGRGRRGPAGALDELLPLQREDFIEIFEAMDGLPVTVRLLDPPLHEFLPDFTELSVKVAVAEATRQAARHRLAAAARRAPAARGEPDARPARGAPRHRHPRPVRDAGPRRSLEAAAIVAERGRPPAARDHGPARRGGRGAAQHPRRDRRRRPPGARKHSVHLDHLDRHDDRAAPGRPDRRRHRRRWPTSSRSAPTT